MAYVQIYAQVAQQCFGDQEYKVIEVRDAETLREVGRKDYEKCVELNGVSTTASLKRINKMQSLNKTEVSPLTPCAIVF